MKTQCLSGNAEARWLCGPVECRSEVPDAGSCLARDMHRVAAKPGGGSDKARGYSDTNSIAIQLNIVTLRANFTKGNGGREMSDANP
jgi:hypothetical protein